MGPFENKSVGLPWLAWLGAVVGLFSVHVGRVWKFTPDDAAVAFSYARNVVDGHGYVLCPGAERVEAPESLLWVLFLTLAHPLHLAHEVFSKLLGLVFGAGALIAVAFFPSVAYGRRPRAFDLVAPAVAASFAHLALWTASGLETGLYTFLSSLSLVAFAWEEHDARRPPWSALGLSALVATRPDGAASLLVCLGVKCVRAGRSGLRRQDVFWALVAMIGVGALELFRMAYFAAALPSGARMVGRAGLAYVVSWVRAYRLEGLLAVAPVATLSTRAWPARVALALVVLAGFALPLYRYRDGMEEWRELAFVTPLACLLIAEALRVLLRSAIGIIAPARRRTLATVLTLLAAWGFVRGATRAYSTRFAAVRAHSIPTLGAERLRARYFVEAARALGLREVSVLDPAIGGLSYGSGLRVVDPLGVGDVAIAHARAHDPRALLDVVFFERRPHFIRVDAARLPPSPVLERLYFPLPERIGDTHAVGDNRVRRELLAAPWNELASTPAERIPGGPDRITVATDALTPGEPLSALVALTDATTLETSTVFAVTNEHRDLPGDVQSTHGVVDARRFMEGERLQLRFRFRLPVGTHRIEWHRGDRVGVLASVRVDPGAGARASAEARAHIDWLLARDRVNDARHVALRLLVRLEDVPGDVDARGALTRFARFLASRAVRLGDAGAFAIAAELAREVRRFDGTDPEVNAALGRLVEAMADASRRAERRGERARAFSLARDAVLLDPRRSWLRRRAETWRSYAPRDVASRDVSAYEAACGALVGGDLDAALVALADVGRWREAVVLADRVGRAPRQARAVLTLIRGHLGRGDFSEARALADGVACELRDDAELLGALRTAGWEDSCQGRR